MVMSRIMCSLSGRRTWQRAVVPAWPPGISRPGSPGCAYVHAIYALGPLGRATVTGALSVCARTAAPSPCNPGATVMIRVSLCRCCLLAWLRVATARPERGGTAAGRRDRLQHQAPEGGRCVTAQAPSWLVEAACAGHANLQPPIKAVLIGLSRWRHLCPVFRGETDETQRRVVAALPAPVNHVLGLRCQASAGTGHAPG